MLLLEVTTLELGGDVRAAGVDLRTAGDDPASGPETAAIWARVLPALAAEEPWSLDFFSHLKRVREFCTRHGIAGGNPAGRDAQAIVIPTPPREQLEALIARFEGETFGARAGQALAAGDAALECELVRRGLDAYHPVFGRYLFCAVCEFAEGSLVVLSLSLDAAEIVRRLTPALAGLEVEVFQPS